MKRLQAVFNIQISQRGCPVSRKSTNHLSGGTAGTDAVGTIPSTDELSRVDYCGNMVYDRGERRLFLENGYVTFDITTNASSYHFYQRDHLGNNRVVFNQTGTVEQVTHYYPFGGVMRESTNPGLQPYKYGGKELDRTSGLDAYDFGARMYFADRLQWGQMDPLCEKYYEWSPYNYCVNNPVNAFDADGMKFEWVASSHSDVIYSKVQALRMESEVFNVLYSYLDNLNETYYIYIDDEDVQRSIHTESGNPNARASGYFDGVNKIVFSEIEADTGAFTEELFHAFQNKQYGNTRETWELDAEAKILNSIVSIEIEVDGKGIENILQAIEQRGGLPTFFYDFTLQNNLSIPRYSDIEKSYFNDYLPDFSNYNDNEGNVYRGKQRQLPPNAYNYIISLAF